MLRRLNELPQSSFTEALVLLLERLGISSLRTTLCGRACRRARCTSRASRAAAPRSPVAVVLKRGGEIGRERVIELRGSLHHYNQAQAVWMLSTGTILSGAREEAAQPGPAPVTLIDGSGLGRMLDEHSVLVQHATVTLPWLDVDLFDVLRGG
ncbi:MAG: restriction endonuclease [Polyangiales bacterium]